MENSKILKTSSNKREYIDKYIAKFKDTPEYKAKRVDINKNITIKRKHSS